MSKVATKLASSCSPPYKRGTISEQMHSPSIPLQFVHRHVHDRGSFMNAHAFSAQWLMEKAAADIAAVESRWGAVVGVHLAPDDLVAFDSMIATVRPGASRDAVLADIVQALLEGAQAWLARGVS